MSRSGPKINSASINPLLSRLRVSRGVWFSLRRVSTAGAVPRKQWSGAVAEWQRPDSFPSSQLFMHVCADRQDLDGHNNSIPRVLFHIAPCSSPLPVPLRGRRSTKRTHDQRQASTLDSFTFGCERKRGTSCREFRPQEADPTSMDLLEGFKAERPDIPSFFSSPRAVIC